MSNHLFSKEDIFSAYKKLKHYFYYDNTSLFIRQRISDFESVFDAKGTLTDDEYNVQFLQKMEEIAVSLDKDIPHWRTRFNVLIDVKITPKSFEKHNIQLLSNRTIEEDLKATRVNALIDASIEVHIIAVLWLMYVGPYLSKWVDKDNYAYKLELENNSNNENLVNGLRLYKPYFTQYQNWRDKAIEKAEQILLEKKDLVILSLDIKDYFHSVRINLEAIRLKLFEENPALKKDEKITKLFLLLQSINSTYTKKLSLYKKLPNLGRRETILPIGLLSSGLLGNIVLRDFDKELKERLNPPYYGRYVDDILIVMTNVSVNHKSIYPVNEFLNKYFVNRGILEFNNPDDKECSEFFKKRRSKNIVSYVFNDWDINQINTDSIEYLKLLRQADKIKFNLVDMPDLIIQSKKVILQDLNHKESPAIINIFKKNLEKNRSEFRFLPDEDEVDKEFDEAAFSLHYNDSMNKLRSIKEFSEDKYGASKYLAGKIFSSSLSDEKPDKKTTNQILTFFKGVIGLSFHTLWEKVATYFIVNNQSDALLRFYRQAFFSIGKINLINYEDENFSKVLSVKLDTDLKEFLLISIATPLAFNPQFNTANWARAGMGTDVKLILKLAYSIRSANLFRHSWISLPGVNFTNYLLDNGLNNNLLKISDDDIKNGGTSHSPREKKAVAKIEGTKKLLEVNNRLALLSPRYVHFHEFNILEIYKTVHFVSDVEIENINRFNQIPENAFNDYWKVNQLWKFNGLPPDKQKEFIERKRLTYFEILTEADSKSDRRSDQANTTLINVKDEVQRSSQIISNGIDKKVALANIKVNPKNVAASYLGSPNTSRDRRQELFKLINLVEQEKCDLLVLPEVSVPYQWINVLAYQSYRRNIGIIAGLEHWVNKYLFAFNFMVTILPIKKEHYKTCLITIRLKNHYSPEEKKQLKGYRLLIPGELAKKEYKRYHLFKWRNSYFSVYNCFELADIKDRGLFKSKVDFLVASEYNKDTAYFSEIAGAWVRDIHCFFIQVNSSDFGDSRVIQPSPSVSRNILQIKGGDNSAIIVGRLPIEKLREFQLKEYDLQKDDGLFKPTPPDFEPNEVLKRIKNC